MLARDRFGIWHAQKPDEQKNQHYFNRRVSANEGGAKGEERREKRRKNILP